MLSRVADSLYWMSRYLERAEHTARVMGVHMNLLLEHNARSGRQQQELLVKGLALDLDWEGLLKEGDDSLLWAMTFSMTGHIPSILGQVAAARENARQVREQISSEMWNQLNQFYLDMSQAQQQELWRIQPHSFYLALKNGAHLFQGITDSTMNHNEGWHFIQLGRYIERTIMIANLLDAYVGEYLQGHRPDQAAEVYFEWLALLKSLTAFEAYTKVYQADIRPDQVVEFVLFSAEFPHSVRFGVDRAMASLEAIAEATHLHRNSRLHRLLGKLQSALSYGEIDDILNADLHAYLSDIKAQSEQIHSMVYETYIAYPVDLALKLDPLKN